MAALDSLERLPNELLYMIGGHLPGSDNTKMGSLAALCLTCHRFNAVFEQQLYRIDARYGMKDTGAMAFGAMTGQVRVLEKSFAQGGAINDPDEETYWAEETVKPIHHATRCSDGSEQALEWLLDHGADVHSKAIPDRNRGCCMKCNYYIYLEPFAQLPLRWTICEGNIPGVRVLIRRGALDYPEDQAVATDYRNSAMFCAVEHNRHELVLDVLQAIGPDAARSILQMRGRYGYTLLDALVRNNGPPAIIRAVLEMGAATELGDEGDDGYGETPLWRALLFSQWESVTALLDYGARQLDTDPNTWRNNDDRGYVYFILLQGAGCHDFRRDGATDPMRRMVTKGILFPDRLWKGKTPLGNLIEGDWDTLDVTRSVEFLLDIGADPNLTTEPAAPNSRGTTALFNLFDPHGSKRVKRWPFYQSWAIHRRSVNKGAYCCWFEKADGNLADIFARNKAIAAALLDHGASLNVVRESDGLSLLDRITGPFYTPPKRTETPRRRDLLILRIVRFLRRYARPEALTPAWTRWEHDKTTQLTEPHGLLTILESNPGGYIHIVSQKGVYKGKGLYKMDSGATKPRWEWALLCN
ncbi:hypothetical protein B0H66DRAFT_624831 [Apodospora peruviana]|uniref:Ankyrin n=1 Tax=Apodospora peruviana TaxID=516989 RepID=A0AAE0I1R2_9PEZI|nr:hypothetical protein B0H66DRAFT_624831 [Apodospora peruviana]